ncbi:hypothetical protein SSABA_v1c02970 [Spiroplasma sabaudiense Ar-1343]|uniref:HAD superfamily hydrolase n=1 Tax=Spiroplasma sabaudiense Ar-1343 TaxID=1276257 RepID=W6AJ33_9MOLU|nr:HAD-IIB family hydrolase [Spiroplasma sabaudiense]AHI53709.1 hypothetical protein SSABA_v1c02970 [Spiroplasma sabaudiense Ar-1343]
MNQKQKLIFKISLASVISGLLFVIGFLTSFIRFTDYVVLQLSDGLFLAFCALIPGSLMLGPAVVYPLIIDLSAGVFAYIPISISIRILMFLVVKILSKKITAYGSFIIASFLVLLYLPFTYFIFKDKGLLILEIVTDSIQGVISILFSSLIYFSINKSSSLKELLNFRTKYIPNQKWWFSDYDGTLSFNSNSDFDKKSYDFINEWTTKEPKQNNFTFTTGRLYSFILTKTKHLKFKPKYTICANGTLIYSRTGNIIYSNPIPKKTRIQLIAYLKTMTLFPIDVAIQGEKLLFHHYYNDNLDERRKINKKHFEDNYENVEKLFLHSKNVNVAYIYTEKDHQSLIKIIKQKFPDLEALQTSPFIVEIFSKKASKWNAIHWIITREKIKLQNTFATGDGDNDYLMLKNIPNSWKMKKHSKMLTNLEIPIISNVNEISNEIT